ncbi:MAG: hypothetical protein V4481_04805 [Patescibacteria group bacterium]
MAAHPQDVQRAPHGGALQLQSKCSCVVLYNGVKCRHELCKAELLQQLPNGKAWQEQQVKLKQYIEQLDYMTTHGMHDSQMSSCVEKLQEAWNSYDWAEASAQTMDIQWKLSSPSLGCVSATQSVAK